jgi:hypothetical protein
VDAWILLAVLVVDNEWMAIDALKLLVDECGENVGGFGVRDERYYGF